MSQISLVKLITPSCIRNYSNTHWVWKKSEEFRPLVVFQVKASRRSDVRKFSTFNWRLQWFKHSWTVSPYFYYKEQRTEIFVFIVKMIRISFVFIAIDQNRCLPQWSSLVADCWRISMEYYNISQWIHLHNCVYYF